MDTSDVPDDFRASVRIDCSTPHRSLTLTEPAGSKERRHIRLEMKEHSLARMLCCRLDLRCAIEVEEVRCRGATESEMDLLARICRPAPWVQWFTDYV